MNDAPIYINQNLDKSGNNVYKINRPLLAKYIKDNCNYLFVRNNARSAIIRYWYCGGVYKMVTDDEIKGFIKQYISDFDANLVRLSTINEVLGLMYADCDYVEEGELNKDECIINFKNGLYNIITNDFVAHTPDIYSTIQLPCDFTQINENPEVFTKYLYMLTSGDSQKAKLILQFLAVAISNIKGFRFKKSLFLIGDGNTGKSQIRQLVDCIIGKDNCSSMDIFQLEKRFGVANLYNKRLVGSADMSFQEVKELAIFKKLTGGDSIFAEYKGQNGFDFVYNGLIWCCGNKMPTFSGDQGEWVYDRIIIINCNNVIPFDNQDKHLLDKMLAEIPQIINLALSTLSTLLPTYQFSVPLECNKINNSYRNDNDIVRKFYSECCEFRQPGRCTSGTTKDIYNFFQVYCNENYSGAAIRKSEFNTRLCSILKVTKEQLIIRQNDNTYYIFNIKP